MKSLAALISLFAIARAATLLPIDSSIVNVKSAHAGQDYSYSIQENRGFAINPTASIHPGVPIVPGVPGVPLASIVHGTPTHQEIRPQVIAKTVPEQLMPGQGIPAGSYPTSYLGYVPITYQQQQGFPYGYTYPYNFLNYRLA